MVPDFIDGTAQVDMRPEVQVEERSLGLPPETITVYRFSVNVFSYPLR